MERCILLLLATNAVDTVDPRAVDEIREIGRAIRSASQRDSFEPLQYSGLRVSDIRELLLRHNPHILHISGHARLTEGLVLDDDNSDTAKIECDQLVKLILSSIADDRLKLVYFSFCHSEVCANEILAKVPYAVGVRDKIRAESSLLFSKAFYEALASDRSVQRAFDNAREWLKTRRLEDSDAMVLRVQSGTTADVPFLNSTGFLKKSVEEPSNTESILRDLSAGFVSQLRIAGYVTDENDVRRAIYLDEGLYVHRVRAEAAVSEFITKATADTSRAGKWLSIVGDAGHGKSSLLWYLFTDLSADPAFTVIPLMAQMESDLAAVVRTTAQAREVRRQSQLVVLIDTLDLMVGIDDQRLAKSISELKALGALVITNSRKQEADQLGRLLSSNSRVELRRYNDHEAQQAIGNQVRIYYRDKSESKQQEQFDKVWGLLEQQRDVRELDLEPLILRMLFEAYAPKDIPRDVNTQQIYRHYWQNVVLFDRVVKNADERMQREHLCRYIARNVAFGESHSDKFLIGSLMKNPDKGLHFSFQTIEGLVSSGVLQWAEGRSSVRFFHQTFLEFTAAYDLLSLDRDSLHRYVTQLFEDVASFNFFRAPILKQLTIQSFDSDQELHLQLMRGLRQVNNELAAQLALEIIGKIPASERSHQIVRQWIEERPQTLRGVICETVRHYPKSKTELALDLLQPYISSDKETSIYSICTETFSRSDPEIVHRFLHRQLSRVIEANDDTKTYFKNALCAVARYGAANAVNDLLELLPAVKSGQQSAILTGIAEVLSAETAPHVERVVRKVIILLPEIPGEHRNEVWDSLCRLTGELNRVSAATAQTIASWLTQSKIWRRDINTALFVGRIVGQIAADEPSVNPAIDELRSDDHLVRMFHTGLLANAPPELSQRIMERILEIDPKPFSGIDSVRALFTVVSGLTGISANQMLEFLSRWTWPTSGIGNPLRAILKRLATTAPQATKNWLLTQLKQPQAHNLRIIRALTLLIQEKAEIFDSAELDEVYEASFAVQGGSAVIAAAVGAIATVDRPLAQTMFTRLFNEEGKYCQITVINSLVYLLASDPEFALQFGTRIIEVSLQQHIPGLLDNYLVTLKSTPRRHSALLLSHFDSWFTDTITQQQDAKILGELLALLKITAEADPDLSFRISQRIPIVSKGIAGGLAALYDNVSEHSDDPELLGSVLQAVAIVAAYNQVRIGNALSRTLPRLGQKIGTAPVIEMVMSVYKNIKSEQSLRALFKAALEIPGWGPKENAALLADKDLPEAVRSVLSTRTRR
ncbi:MAG: CHAT domain-containing protein [Pyrinomonadaceae bacterium]